jgi:hypothetical protein
MLIIGGLILWIGRRRNRTKRDLVLPERDVKPGRARTRNSGARAGSSAPMRKIRAADAKEPTVSRLYTIN